MIVTRLATLKSGHKVVPYKKHVPAPKITLLGEAPRPGKPETKPAKLPVKPGSDASSKDASKVPPSKVKAGKEKHSIPVNKTPSGKSDADPLIRSAKQAQEAH